jgi:hypothetical protein
VRGEIDCGNRRQCEHHHQHAGDDSRPGPDASVSQTQDAPGKPPPQNFDPCSCCARSSRRTACWPSAVK